MPGNPSKCSVTVCDTDPDYQIVFTSCSCPSKYLYYCRYHLEEKILGQNVRYTCKVCNTGYPCWSFDKIERLNI